MQIAVVHGYFLHDSGSAIYTRELVRELVRLGHEVTLVCQEQDPQRYDFIDHAFDLAAGNTDFIEVLSRPRLMSGSCRLVRPDIGGRLLTYVSGPFPGFQATAYQDAPSEQIERYVEANASALSSVFDRWEPGLVHASHLVTQPFSVLKALGGKPVPLVVTVHGSELNFTVLKDRRMVPYALAALREAAEVYALSSASLAEIGSFAASEGLPPPGNLHDLPPGIDSTLFIPVRERAPALRTVSEKIDPEQDDIAIFAGRLLWTKGLQYLVAALPLVLRRRPDLHLLVAGSGPALAPLESMISFLEEGDLPSLARLLAAEKELRAAPEFGPVMLPLEEPESRRRYLKDARGLGERIHFLGHIDHDRLAQVMAAADISLAPSVFREAFGLVSIEALSAGALPLATYQSGLRTPVDAVAESLHDDSLRGLRPGIPLTAGLADIMISLLERYDTRDQGFRQRLHDLAEHRFSWETVARRMLAAAQRPERVDK